MRLNLFIAKTGIASRRKADSLIKEGKVEVNGKGVYQPFFSVQPTDIVKVSGKQLKIADNLYVLLHKPRGVTTTLADKFAKKTVIDLLPKQLKSVYPVGRLDKDSSGLLILTNDGDLCYRVTHPKFEIEKEYLIKVSGKLSGDGCKRAVIGVVEQGEHLSVKQATVIKTVGNTTFCRVVVCEGKKRHIRRLFKKLGFVVLELKRLRIGGLKLGDLPEGKFKVLSSQEIIEALFSV